MSDAFLKFIVIITVIAGIICLLTFYSNVLKTIEIAERLEKIERKVYGNL